jgi:hypothetical protein
MVKQSTLPTASVTRFSAVLEIHQNESVAVQLCHLQPGGQNKTKGTIDVVGSNGVDTKVIIY